MGKVICLLYSESFVYFYMMKFICFLYGENIFNMNFLFMIKKKIEKYLFINLIC